jgi:hypothetical protein
MKTSDVVLRKKSSKHANLRGCPECRYALYPNTGACTNYECPNYRHSGVMSAAQLLHDFEKPRLTHGRQWGDWTLDTERMCLVFEGKPIELGDGTGITVGVPRYIAIIGHYEIDLERIRDSAAALDWIFQILGKNWATQRVIRDLLNAIRDIIHPQQNLCSGACGSGGGGKVIKDPGAFLRHRIETVGKSTRVTSGAS